MKNVLFDGTAMQGNSSTVFHGGAEYAKFIFRESIKRGYKFDLVINDNLIMDESILRIILDYNINVFHVKSIREIYKLIDNSSYERFYSALPYNYIDYKYKTQFVGVIHGLRAIELPWDSYKYKYYSNIFIAIVEKLINILPCVQKFFIKRYKKEMDLLLKVENSKFITVSEHSKYALLSYFPNLQIENIEVFYSPFAICNKSKCVKEKYFLMVSGNRFEKNVCRAIEVFDELFLEQRCNDYKVIITGCGNQPFFKKIKNKDKFILKPYVISEELEDLYSKAFCFVYPSLNEGFGYPPLKAMGYEVPVIASAATSIPEVCGDAALYFTPLDKGELKNRILQILNNSNLVHSLIMKGKRRVNELIAKQESEIENELNWIFDHE